MLNLRRGDPVAVLPAKGALVEEVVEIATVNYVSRAFIQLTDGRLYAKADGRCMGSGQGGYIVAASQGHREALEDRQRNADRPSNHRRKCACGTEGQIAKVASSQNSHNSMPSDAVR